MKHSDCFSLYNHVKINWLTAFQQIFLLLFLANFPYMLFLKLCFRSLLRLLGFPACAQITVEVHAFSFVSIWKKSAESTSLTLSAVIGASMVITSQQLVKKDMVKSWWRMFDLKWTKCLPWWRRLTNCADSRGNGPVQSSGFILYPSCKTTTKQQFWFRLQFSAETEKTSEIIHSFLAFAY